MTMRIWVLLLAGVLVGDAEAAVGPVLPIDPRDETPLPVQSQPHTTVVPQPPVTASPAMAEPAPSAGNPLWGIPLRQLSATRERPLFTPSRRPPQVAVAFQPAAAPPPAPPKAVEPEKPPFSLVGTVAGESAGYAVFLDQSDKAVLRLKTGESHNGWALREVRGRAVVLQKGYATAVLTLPVPSMTKADAPQPGLAMQTPAAPQVPPQVTSGTKASGLFAPAVSAAAAAPPPSGSPPAAGVPANPLAALLAGGRLPASGSPPAGGVPSNPFSALPAGGRR